MSTISKYAHIIFVVVFLNNFTNNFKAKWANHGKKKKTNWINRFLVYRLEDLNRTNVNNLQIELEIQEYISQHPIFKNFFCWYYMTKFPKIYLKKQRAKNSQVTLREE